MTDYSAAQFEAQRLEIACLKREMAEYKEALYAAGVTHAEQRADVEKYKRLWHAAQSSTSEYAGRLAIAEEQRDECRRLLREITWQPEPDSSAAGFPREPDASVWRLRWVQIEAWKAAAKAGGDDGSTH